MYWQLFTRAPSPRLKLKSPKDESKAPITVPVTIWPTKGSLGQLGEALQPCSFSVSNSFTWLNIWNEFFTIPSRWIGWWLVWDQSIKRNHIDLIDLMADAAGGTTIFATTDSSISDGVGSQLGDEKKAMWPLGSSSPLQVCLECRGLSWFKELFLFIGWLFFVKR